MNKPTEYWDDEPIHSFFGLSYAQYLAVPRTVLQSMPKEWQSRFVKCLEEMNEAIDWMPEAVEFDYRVQLYGTRPDAEGDDYWKYTTEDPLADYQRGRRRLELKPTDKSSVSPAKDGCWFCHTLGKGHWLFSKEFDCYLHVHCLKRAVRTSEWDGPELDVFKAEFAGVAASCEYPDKDDPVITKKESHD